MSSLLQLSTVQPMVRYVDQEQAIIDTHFTTLPALPPGNAPPPDVVEVLLHIAGSDGFEDEGRTRLTLRDNAGSIRFDLVHPERWWPAGMGEQPLYTLTLTLLVGDEIADQRTMTLGLTSVRRETPDDLMHLRVNGEICEIQSLLFVDRIAENRLLPATGDSLLMVRDHYGSQSLYDAADRAGILLIQCIPISPEGVPSLDLAQHMERLIPHPSLAGWFVGHLGTAAPRVAKRLQALDPTRTIFLQPPTNPGQHAA